MPTEKKVLPDSILERNPKVRRLFDQLAQELKCIRQTVLDLYGASLNVWCPGWEKLAKSKRQSLTKRTLTMEASIKDSMVARGYNRRALTSYLYGAFEEVLVGLQNASHRPISIPKRIEMATKIASGMPPEEAKKEVMDRRESKFVKLTFFSFRPPGVDEDMSEYITELEAELNTYLAEWDVQVSVKIAKKRRAAKAEAKNKSWATA